MLSYISYFISDSGKPTISDERLMRLYDMVEESGNSKWVFFSGSCCSREQFPSFVRGLPLFCEVLKDGHSVGFIVLDHFKSKSAYFHFCAFPQEVKKVMTIFELIRESRELINNIMKFLGLDLLLGLIPNSNKSAIRMATVSGWERLGELPKSSFNAGTGKSETSTLFYLERGGKT